MLIKGCTKTCVTAWEIVILLSERAERTEPNRTEPNRTEPNRTEPNAKHLYTPFKYTEAVKLLKNDKNIQNASKSIRSDIKGRFEGGGFFRIFPLLICLVRAFGRKISKIVTCCSIISRRILRGFDCSQNAGAAFGKVLITVKTMPQDSGPFRLWSKPCRSILQPFDYG